MYPRLMPQQAGAHNHDHGTWERSIGQDAWVGPIPTLTPQPGHRSSPVNCSLHRTNHLACKYIDVGDFGKRFPRQLPWRPIFVEGPHRLTRTAS